ncbi:MAG: diaminopimelate decarboxylase [Chloroflexi bacterium]|nr:diaminopimelate decarboxylase [Chloroflexota bacterium]
MQNSLSKLFPRTARVNADDHLEIGGRDVVALAREYGTPLYIFDEEHLIMRAREIREAFRARDPNTLVLYATKAYFSPYVARLFQAEGLGLDVTSEAELEIARRADFPRDQIYLHGNNKTPAEIRTAFAMGVDHIIVDNLDEVDLLARIATEMHVAANVLLRLAPNIDPHTHKYLATGVAESKFGLPLAIGDAFRAAELVTRHSPLLTLVGLHLHIGSQIFDPDPYRAAIRAAANFAAHVREKIGVELREWDLGGGWGVAYTEEQTTLTPSQVASHIFETLDELPITNYQLLFEPGRALIAQSAVALYTVGAVKEIAGVRTYISVDGGMGDNVRPALYDARYTARVANKMNAPPAHSVAIAGRYCEQGDILIENVALPRVAAGDLIVMPVAGAYHLPMASNYNLIPRPAVLVVRDGKARVIRRRETVEDMLECEVDT